MWFKICVVNISLFIMLILISCDNHPSVLLLPKEEMNEDICYYYSELNKMHPEFDPDSLIYFELEKMKKKLSPKSSNNFAFLLMKVQKMMDDHTGILYNIGFEESAFLSEIYLKNDRLMLNNDTLVTINGDDVSCIISKLDSMVSDSYLKKQRIKKMKILLRYFLYANRYNCKLKNDIFVKDTIIYTNDSKIKNIISSQLYDSIFINNSIAVLRYNSCMIINDNEKNKFSVFLNNFFSKLSENGIKTLCIDVTENGGGIGWSNTRLLNCLDRDSCLIRLKMQGKSNAIKKFMSSDFSSKEWNLLYGEKLMKNQIVENELIISSNKTGYKGAVLLIMGNNTFSSAADFCLFAKASKAAILIGETAGQCYPIYGNVIRDTLPNSKIQFQVPTTKTFFETNVISTDGFLYPDIKYLLRDTLGIRDYVEIVDYFREYMNL